MSLVVTGISHSGDITVLEAALKEAGLSIDPIRVIGPDDSTRERPSIGVTVASNGAANANGHENRHFRKEVLRDRLGDLILSEGEADDYANALAEGRTVVAYLAQPEHVAQAEAIIRASHVFNVKTFQSIAALPSFRANSVDVDVDDVNGSEFFDERFYAQASGAAGSRRELIQHFLAHGEPALLSPSRDFDVVFYRSANPDIAANGMNSLLHYIRCGLNEGRYPNKRRLVLDAERLENSGIFNRGLPVQQYRPALVPGLNDIEAALIERNFLIGPWLDERFYYDAYEDVRNHRAKPMLHYADIGRHQGRPWCSKELDRRRSVIAAYFDAAHYLAQVGDEEELPEDPLEHYLLHGGRLGRDPSAEFSVEYYLQRYPDVTESGTDSFTHFIEYGRAEGRIGQMDFTPFFVRGNRAFDLTRPTIIIANHEASRTGAPLLGLKLANKLAEKYNIITILGESGPLDRHFMDCSTLVVTVKTGGVDAEYLLRQLRTEYRAELLLMNSVETHEFAYAALFADMPSVALVHEFAEYSLPPGKVARVVQSVDRIVVPADVILESLQREITDHCANPTNNVVVRPQGYLSQLPSDDSLNDLTREQILAHVKLAKRGKTKIVLGAGTVQMRKGNDIFVQTAAAMRKLCGDDFRFIWVGSGYNPERDLPYSTWIADAIRRLDLEDRVFFLPPQESLDVLFELADVFYLSSRLDPFPNVVLDAFKANKAVVCFDRVTGVAPLLRDGEAHGAAVEFGDIQAAAQALFDWASRDEDGTNPRFVERQFDFDEYTAFIDAQFPIAKAFRRELIADARRVRSSGTFVETYHDSKKNIGSIHDSWRSALAYTARGQRGLFTMNPRPGFSDGLYWSVNGKPNEPRRSAFAAALRDRDPSLGAPTTHRCVALDDGKVVEKYTGRVALHLHLHYPDLAAEFMERLVAARTPLDLYITTTSTTKRVQIEYAFRKYSGGELSVFEVPNRGRNIAPLLSAVKEPLRAGNYDVIGHLHGKQTLVVSGDLGDRWRKYLLHNLLPDHDRLQRLLAIFAEDPTVGLVFAEDRHAYNWTRNRKFAEELADKLQPRPQLPEFPIFPLGTMFWARPAALEPLWNFAVDETSFPMEPIPYDGSMLHAIERMLPAVAESTGHTWSTVYREGLPGW